VNGETNGIDLPISGQPSPLEELPSQLDDMHELETSNTELSDANERLLAAMEELQSLNVALQSVNDALHGMNIELRGKLDSLRHNTLDVELMLNGVDVGAVLLNARLEVRNFNATAARFMALGTEDIGKSLGRLRHDLGSVPIVELCRQALLTGDPIERIFTASSGESIGFRAREVGLESADPGLMLTFTELRSTLPHWESELA
jgi:nitrogen fixation/metabolism regulation signal transduction histidine kinase